MQKHISRVTQWAYRVIASTRFFVLMVGLLVTQSVWMAFSAVYPLPFDEYYHVGVIQMYARQWLPFITEQPPEAAIYGDITRAGSYLYHYLMSFPYRVLDVVFDSEMALIISLRLINIVMVIGALILFRKLFIIWKIPKRVMHVVFLMFVFTPIVPFVAAHVNYDNLVIVIMPAVLILGTRLIVDRGDMAWNGALFVFLGLIGVLAKETFAPPFAVISLYVAWRLWREHGTKSWMAFRKSFRENIRHVSFLFALLGLLVTGGLLAEYSGGNLIRYGSLRAKCEVVQSASVCEKNSVWYRNQENIRKKPFIEEKYGNPLSFTQHWVSKSIRGFFVPFSHTPTQVIWDKEPFGPIVTKAIVPVGFIFGSVAVVAGVLLIILRGKELWRDKPLRFALAVCGVYLAVLWTFNYQAYLYLGEAEAIQARYSYPILLLLFLLMIKSADDFIPGKRMKAGLLAFALLLFVWGGGIVPWLIRADDTWRWQNATVQSVNREVQTVLKRIVIH